MIGGAEPVGEGGGVDRGVRRAIAEVPDRFSSQVRRLEAGEAGGAGRARRAVGQGLVAGGDDVAQDGWRDEVFELGSGGDVHAALGDPVGLEAAGVADVEARYERVDEGLVSGPAG